MSLDLFIPFLIATVIFLATPGPTILLIVSYALAKSRGLALAVVGGVILGDLLAMSAALLGLGVIMTASASLFTVMIATFVGLGGVNALAYALLAATLRSKVARPDRMAWLQRGSGAVLIGLAVFTTTLRRA